MNRNFSPIRWCFYSALFLVIFCSGLNAAEKPVVTAARIIAAPKIDGQLSELIWQNAPVVSGFVQNQPSTGNPSQHNSQVKIVYDNDAIYIGAFLADVDKDSISETLTQRDETGFSDWFVVMLDPYQAGINGVGLCVTAAGVQVDVRYTQNGESSTWNAVWESEVFVTDEGWFVEMKIPFSVVRFSSDPDQTWGINFGRRIRRLGEISWWSPVDPNIRGFVNQAGILKGIKDIKPPPRLFFNPYVSSIFENSVDGTNEGNFNGGMDVKYGINDAFTLDMTLVPDFAQVRSDNQVLNLSPFEVQFDENRPFFTEGVELFNQGNLFYSRRVGGIYGLVDDLEENEEVVERNSEAPLINAVKVSGRNGQGYGFGFFNAVTNRTTAKVENTETGQTREIQADPLTNFNVMVVDRNLKNNSSVGIINTMVLRENNARKALVSGGRVNFFDKNTTYRFSAKGAISQVITDEDGEAVNDVGHQYDLQFQKVSGKLRYRIYRNEESHNYNPNDMGFLRSPNEVSYEAGMSYVLTRPFGVFNRFSYELWSWHTQLQYPREYDNWGAGTGFNGQFRNFWNFSWTYRMSPTTNKDHFRARTEGRIFRTPKSYSTNLWVRSDRRKNLSAAFSTGYWYRKAWDSFDTWINIDPSWRINDRLGLSHSFSWTRRRRERGYVTKEYDDQDELKSIVFGNRFVETTVNTFSAIYGFNNRMVLNLRVRHYWSTVDYRDFYDLDSEGFLDSTDYVGVDETGEKINNANFNAFNVDLVYNWQFAPGSQLSVVWKNAIFTDDHDIQPDFQENFTNTINTRGTNQVSVKVLYFIDYLTIRRALKPNPA